MVGIEIEDEMFFFKKKFLGLLNKKSKHAFLYESTHQDLSSSDAKYSFDRWELV